MKIPSLVVSPKWSLPAFLLAVALSPNIHAQTSSNWIGTTGNWTDAGSWSAGVPDASVVGAEEGDISNAGDVTIDSVVPDVLNVYVGRNFGNSGTLTIADGGALTILGSGLPGAESLKIGTDGGSGILNQTGGTLTQVTGDFRLGNYGDGGSGTFNLSGGTAAVNSVRVGIGNVNQTGLLNQTGGTLSNTGEFQVGIGPATGTYLLNGAGAIANLNEVRVGVNSGGSGTFTHTAGTLTNTGEFQVGINGGVGTFNVGASASINQLRAGLGGAGDGTIVHTAGTLSNTGDLILGLNGGTGEYQISGSAEVTSTDRIRVGVSAGSVGLFTQDGGTVTTSSGRLDIGDGGAQGTYVINGGTLNIQAEIFAGYTGASNGTFTLNGGTAIASNLRFAFSNESSGTVNLNGGTLSVNTVFEGDGGGTSTLNFNGGTLQVRSGDNSGNFITGIDTITMGTNGGTIDTNGFDTGIHSSISGTGSLTKAGADQLKVENATLSYTGDTIISEGQFSLLSTATMIFDINASGVNNMVTGNGSGTLNLFGTVAFDLADADAAGSWTVLDYANLTLVNFGETFTVTGFTESSEGIWTMGDYTFTETTGMLTAVPEPGTVVLFGLGGLVALTMARRRSGRA